MKDDNDDAGEHIGFVFECQGYKLSYMTDLGSITDTVMNLIMASDAYVIEANYDKDLQMNSSRPWGLIKRIMGDFGHLSNEQATDYLIKVVDIDKTKKIFLAHLSRDCNNHELAFSTVHNGLKKHYQVDYLPIKIVSEVGKRYHIFKAQ